MFCDAGMVCKTADMQAAVRICLSWQYACCTTAQSVIMWIRPMKERGRPMLDLPWHGITSECISHVHVSARRRCFEFALMLRDGSHRCERSSSCLAARGSALTRSSMCLPSSADVGSVSFATIVVAAYDRMQSTMSALLHASPACTSSASFSILNWQNFCRNRRADVMQLEQHSLLCTASWYALLQSLPADSSSYNRWHAGVRPFLCCLLKSTVSCRWTALRCMEAHQTGHPSCRHWHAGRSEKHAGMLSNGSVCTGQP